MDARKQTLIRIVATALAGLVGLLAALALYAEVKPLPMFPSPSGKWTLKVSVNNDPGSTRHLCLIIDIIDAQGKSLYREVTRASKYMRWNFRWEDDMTLIMDSSDVG